MDYSRDGRSILMRATCVATALLVAGSAITVHAQADPVVIGSRLRITTTVGPVTRIGIFQGTRDSSVLLQTPATSLTFPIGSISRVEVSSGRKLSKTGGVVGFLLGAGAGGFALGCLANRDDYGVLCGGQNDTKFVVGAVAGGLVGGAIGALLFRSERWRPVDLARIR